VSAFANLPISRKLMAAFAAVVVVILASSAIIYDRLRVIELAKNARVHTTDILETLQQAMDAMVDQETGVRGYLISGVENFLEPYHRGSDAYAAAFEKVKDLTRDNPGQQKRLNELNELAKTWLTIAEQEIALMAKPETRAAARGLESSTVGGKATMDLVRGKVDEIGGVERDLLAKREAMQNKAFATAYTTTVLGGLAGLIIATLMGVLLMRGVAVPINRMTSAITALAKGDTTVNVPGVGRGDEIGAMATAAQIFKDNMIERQRAQAELARVGRVTTMGELVASIAHEVNQPLAAILANGEAGLR
jgi:methyl-accepting chemotaxis protein